MRRFIVEKEFEHNGLKCVVLFGNTGHRNGYVGVPKDHPFYGKDYDDDDVCFIGVHGGLTYAGQSNVYPVDSDDLHWFGFDCAHYGDALDIEMALKTFPEQTEHIQFLNKFKSNHHGEIRTLEFVENECKSLAEQLANKEVAK